MQRDPKLQTLRRSVMASLSSEQQLCASLREAGAQAVAAMNYQRHTPSRARALLAERVAANPAIAALLSSLPEEGSLVVAALRVMECDVAFETAWRTLDRCTRFGAAQSSPLAEHTAAEARHRAEAQQQGLKLLCMSEDDVQKINCEAALLLPALRAAMDAVVSCAPGGRLRAATRTELCFLAQAAACNHRLREHSEALQRQGATQQLAHEAAADVALG
jgi:hypothetical protein